jgi:hypothetical protein
LGGSLYTINKNAEALVVCCKVIGLEVNADKAKCVVMSRDHNAGRCMKMIKVRLKRWKSSDIWEQP